jgi:hypothetical protein
MPRFAVLPDGIFSNQKSQFWVNLDGLAKEDVGQFGTDFVIWYIFFPF